jgi:glycine/D-amino acid oxidase-like deaminating enzyme
MRYEVAVIGGGLAGAALARALAIAGLKVLVLERETAFRDRVRGEQMHCWGAVEARTLGIHDLLRESGGHEVRFWSARIAGLPEAPPRDLIETTPQRLAALNFYHPAAQTALLDTAKAAGAEVRREPPSWGLRGGSVRLCGPGWWTGRSRTSTRGSWSGLTAATPHVGPGVDLRYSATRTVATDRDQWRATLSEGSLSGSIPLLWYQSLGNARLLEGHARAHHRGGPGPK